MSVPLAVVAMVAVLVATGCASRGSVKRVQHDVEGLQAGLADLRRDHGAAVVELGRSRDEIRELDARLLTLQTGIREASQEIARMSERLQATEEELRQVRALATVPAPAPAPVITPERPARVVPPADTAEQVYAAALATFRSREHGQAVLDFLDFIAKFPRHALAANAQYWIGEAYYVQRDYRQAMTEFRKVLELYPASPKAADALVKVGLCYTSLRDPARARQAWQRVVATYPSTDAAAIAKTL
ncbi:MAG TPA: tol-pal system protein YbgF, partial [Candidatus Limnocylindria bacterium]|nr:tol-pal system protein YbgF [Candidatus Limnocylindria bacterium]